MAHLRKNVIPDPIQGLKNELLKALTSTVLVDRYVKILADVKAFDPEILKRKNPHYLALAIKYDVDMQETNSTKLDDLKKKFEDDEVPNEDRVHILRYYLWYKKVVDNVVFEELYESDGTSVIYGRWTRDLLKDDRKYEDFGDNDD